MDAAPTAALPPGDTIPVAGAFYAGRLPLGAQSVPLPVGRWLALAVATGPTTAGTPGVTVFLGLILEGRIMAAASIGGSAAPDPHDAGFAAPLEAQNPAFYYRRVLSAVDHGPLDFWVCGISVPAKWNDPLRQAAVGVLRRQSLDLPERFDSAVFRLADKRNWVSVEFMFPTPPGEDGSVPAWTDVATLSDALALPHIEKVRRWGKAWHEVLRRGFAGAPPSPEEAWIPLP
jgi:hypothetical protein